MTWLSPGLPSTLLPHLQQLHWIYLILCSPNIEGKESWIRKGRKANIIVHYGSAFPLGSSMIDCFISQDQLPKGHMNDDILELAFKETKREEFISSLPFPNGQRFTPWRTDSSSLPNCFYKGTEQVCINRESPGWKTIGTWETGLCQVTPTKSVGAHTEPTTEAEQKRKGSCVR